MSLGRLFNVRSEKADKHPHSHCINLTTGADADGAYQLFTAIKADKAAILPSSISFTDGVVLPFAIEAAACALLVREPGPCMPGVSTPALALPAPCLTSTRSDKILIVYGASSSAGLTTTQLAVAGGMIVLGIAGTANHDLVRSSGASAVFDHNDPSLVDDIVSAVRAATGKFVGIFDAISVEGTYARDLDILHQLGGGHLATTHPPPQVPSHVQAGMIFAVNDVAGPVFSDFVTPALESGKLKPLPCPFVVGRGLDCINVGLQKLKAGVSGSKIVVEL